ncbi:hypothetical protein ABNF65_11545 [Paenibacillus larvae]
MNQLTAGLTKKTKKEKIKINLTLTDYLYEKLKKEADQEGVSLNQLIIGYISSINY